MRTGKPTYRLTILSESERRDSPHAGSVGGIVSRGLDSKVFESIVTGRPAPSSAFEPFPVGCLWSRSETNSENTGIAGACVV